MSKSIFPTGWPPRIYQLTPGQLSTVSVKGLGFGQPAFVQSNRFVYILQPAVGVADGTNILDTADDVTQQWVFINYGEPTSFPGYGGAPPSVAATSAEGTAATVSRSDHTHLGVKTVTVANANGGIGISTSDGADWTFQSVPISVANPAALAAIPAAALFTGMPAFCVSNGFLYTLQAPPAGISADTNGAYTVAASGDASRLWIKNGLFTSPQQFVSNEIDFTTSTPVTWGTDWPVIGTTKGPILIGTKILITAIAGSFSANAGLKFGTNSAAFDNIFTTANALTFGSLNSMVATGGTKNFTLATLTQGSNNTALTGLNASPTMTPTAATGTGMTLKGRVISIFAIENMA